MCQLLRQKACCRCLKVIRISKNWGACVSRTESAIISPLAPSQWSYNKNQNTQFYNPAIGFLSLTAIYYHIILDNSVHRANLR